MKKQLNQVLKEQIILEFQQKGLNDLIVFFMAKYPEFPYAELAVEQINQDYLNTYDVAFLASYIRYSDLQLLKSGMQDEEVKEKLFYLHHHIGTILPTYRNFIWSDITLDDIKRWLPLLSEYKIKNRIMKCQNITNSYKHFLDCCLNKFSFAYQNLVLLDSMFSTINFEIDTLAQIKNQKSLHKLLQIVATYHISISYIDLLKSFFCLQKLLEQVSDTLLKQYHTLIVEYLKSPFQHIEIHTVIELKNYSDWIRKENQALLEQKYDIWDLKEFYCWTFLQMHYLDFKTVFDKMPEEHNKQYRLLQELENATFPLFLKGDLYDRFLECENLSEYMESVISKIGGLEVFESKFLFPIDDKKYSLIDIQNPEFYFLSVSAQDYEEAQDSLVATIQKDMSFSYQENCLFGYSKPTILSFQKNTCMIKKEKPEFLVGFDYVSLEHLKYQKELGLPIVIIDTEVYAEKQIYLLQKLYASQNWDAYWQQKRNFCLSISNHPWLSSKYLNKENLYLDVKSLQEQISSWILEKHSASFLKKQNQILKQLISLNQELEMLLEKEKETSFQKNKKMLQ